MPASAGHRFTVPLRQAVGWARRRLLELVGGPARFQVIAILAGVMALDAADKGTIGAVAPELKQSLGITNTQLGALTSVSSGVGALAAVPVGALTDRVNRSRLLAVSIVLWGAAMVAGALAGSFLWLLLSRLALGAVTATSGPPVASLIGDYFPPGERGRIYGFVLSGELLGAGLGLLVGGNLAPLLTWRAAFAVLAVLGLGLVYVIARRLPEPARGGQSRLRPGETRLGERAGGGEEDAEQGPDQDDVARSAVREHGVRPDPALVLRRDPEAMSLWAAARYVLRIRTNVVLIVASALGYFFFAALRTFGVDFVMRRYGLGHVAVSGLAILIGAGALAGVLTGGRVADRLIRRGHLGARVVVPAVAYLLAAGLFLPGLLTTAVVVALPAFLLAAGSLTAANPPLDAARLDVIHFRLWGRAEAVRTVLRMGAEAVAPVTFGLLADVFGARAGNRAQGLMYAFLVMLVPLVANAVILFRALPAYPRDVATAAESEHRATRCR
ncbi:MFS transporter [Actinoallomurus rhizosphaericola]|uniref:MFS transporter n=1 Tax=Actinoallomurus rhizosphaericola TaxID=2952536 RepID=UPI002090DDC8|nr:MFS transporter [Actinoallomurus rhizosphaericola]MCO5992965.1 MFS transporter [Actinoallomurus rhizosphaericola]